MVTQQSESLDLIYHTTSERSSSFVLTLEKKTTSSGFPLMVGLTLTMSVRIRIGSNSRNISRRGLALCSHSGDILFLVTTQNICKIMLIEELLDMESLKLMIPLR